MTTDELQPVIEKVRAHAELWKSLAEMAKWQAQAAGHWRNMLGWTGFSAFGPFAPTHLTQSINPWNISLFQVISGTRGNPQTEVDILTQVASYGSQLGTVIDALMTLLPKTEEERRALDEKSLEAVLKLRALAADIDRIKQT